MFLLIPLVTVYGLLIGSFLTVVVDRVPRGASVNRPPSACGHCAQRLGPLDLVPVASWMVLGGKCRRCRNPIGLEPIVIELANTALWLAFAFHLALNDPFGRSLAALPAFLIFGSVLIAQSVIDIRQHRLPREITYTGSALGAIALTVAALITGQPERIWKAALGAGIAFAFIGVIHLASNARYGNSNGLGIGDVILAPMLGMYLGWINPGLVLPGLILGFVIGAVAVLLALVTKRASATTQLPFGPFMALGSLATVFLATLT